MAISVQFEIGHTAKLRAKKSPEGFTHDWELYVRGTNKADISAYVEKVVFNLHESFQKPKKVYKEPPYVVHESGYASFVLTVDIHFRNRDEPKRVQYPYDLDIQPHGPPHHRSEEKRFVFENPSEEFRQKLLKGGGVPVVPAGLTGSRSGHSLITASSFTEANANSQQTSASNVSKHKSSSVSSGGGESSSKKHKSRTDDTKLNTFANLFGPPDPASKNTSTKSNVDASKNPSSNITNSGKTLSPNATSGAPSVVKTPGKDVKDKQSSSSSAEKTKDKSERKEKHKSSSSSSPSKDGRGDSKKSATSSTMPTETAKPEKQRSEDKPKKDKNRDKDKDRSSSSVQNTSSGSSKSTNSVKSTPISGSIATVSASLQRTSAHGTASNGSTNRLDEKTTNVPSKTDKETKEKHSSSSSSGKKSKKDKKDKDKDREKEKEKREEKSRNSSGGHDFKSKEERSHSSASQSNVSGSPSGQSTPNSSHLTQAQTKSAVSTGTISSSSNNTSTKKSDKDSKGSESSVKKSSENPVEKPISSSITSSAVAVGSADKKSATTNTGNSSNTKSHKHKKKDKNKEKDKDKDKDKERNSTGDKEKDKDKAKEKHKEKIEDKKEIVKLSEPMSNKIAGASTNDAKKLITVSQSASTIGNSSQTATTTSQAIPTSSNTNESSTSNKKSQSKEKKSKDSKSSKDIKRRAEASTPISSVGGEPKSKASKTSTPASTEYSDVDSRQSAHENTNKTAMANVALVAPDLHSDSSYSSFPDIAVKPKEKSVTAPTSSSTSSEKNLKTVSATLTSKENKRDKDIKPSTKMVEKTSKPEKEDKKRRRNTVTSENTFIEPPVKQAKKEQNKSAANSRESTKSPLPSRSVNAVINTKPGKMLSDGNISAETVDSPMQLPAYTSPNAAVSPTAGAIANPANVSTNSIAAVANHANSNNSNNVSAPRNSVSVSATHPASPALSSNDSLWPNLSELQELHHKIMTLQDNQELQQIVEMIAASGCYEVTQRTFDFDLCKLDRGTVERLQEFFATSVS